MFKFFRKKKSDSQSEIKPTVQPEKEIERQHIHFNTLIYDWKYNWYETETLWDNQPVTLTLNCNKPSDFDTLILTAEKLFNEQQIWHEMALKKTINELFELANGEWRENEAPIVTEVEFRNRLHLTEVSIHSNQDFEFCYEANGLFADHGVLISGNLVSGIENVGI